MAIYALILIVLATAADVFSRRREQIAPPEGRAASIRAFAYSFFTMVVAFEMAAGAWWDLLRIEYVRVVMAHLGYPMYLLYILGIWKIPCALVLVLPRFPRLKEWAYAGAVFNYTGAVASHLLSGDPAGVWAGPLVLLGITMASWALRPSGRRLPRPAGETALPASCWVAPVLIVVAMSLVAILTLPKGAPQF